MTTTEGTKINLITTPCEFRQTLSDPTHIQSNFSLHIDLIFTNQSNLVIIIVIIINRFSLTHPLYMVLRSNITFTQYSHSHT